MRTRSTLTVALAMLALALFLGACAEGKDPAESSIKAHPTSWMDAESEDFHGALVARDTPETCTSCHGSDLMGDGIAPSCSQCHDGASGHPVGYDQPPSPVHSDDVAAEGNASCAQCHGEDYRGGWAEDWAADARRASCYYCHGMGPSGHPSGWLTPSANLFHGKAVVSRGLDDCARCHGEDLRGGTSGVSCYNSCHAGPSGHPADWLDPDSRVFHGTRVRDNGAENCKACHGDDYLGGDSGVSCYDSCHDGPGGHPAGWDETPSPFHGYEVIDSGSQQCEDCHGEGNTGGWAEVACADCH